MYYTVYKTTNLINGKYYIGCHQTLDPDDDYLGSGKILKQAIKKYGRENFIKEILHLCETKEEMYAKERELVQPGPDTYNLKEGGFGGFDHIPPEKVSENARNAANKMWDKYYSDPEFREQYKSSRKNVRNARAMLGKKQSEDAKQKIGQANSQHQQGKSNSQYGTCWINKDGENRKIVREDAHVWISQGWLLGRKMGPRT